MTLERLRLRTGPLHRPSLLAATFAVLWVKSVLWWIFGVSLGLGEVSVSWGAAAVLGVNVVLLLLSGVATLAVQRGLAASRSPAREASG